MIKELAKKQENKTLKIFSQKSSEFGKHTTFNPDLRADNISEKLILVAKNNLTQHGFGVYGGKL